MGTYPGWIVVMSAVGSLAALAAGVLLWLILTRPVATAGWFAGGL
ncbi:MAG TPA: hypothetical protein VLA20_01790 [Vicinamibacterales bacterium]|nr:hypothetical protein [Vicinamibacterales bacterium]